MGSASYPTIKSLILRTSYDATSERELFDMPARKNRTSCGFWSEQGKQVPSATEARTQTFAGRRIKVEFGLLHTKGISLVQLDFLPQIGGFQVMVNAMMRMENNLTLGSCFICRGLQSRGLQVLGSWSRHYPRGPEVQRFMPNCGNIMRERARTHYVSVCYPWKRRE